MTILAMWQDVRDAADKLLFKFDPQRDLIQIKRAGVVVVVDLSQYRAPPNKPVDIGRKP